MTRVAVCIAPFGKRRTPCHRPTEPGSLFCRTHERAPAAQRGGWISAANRRRKLAAADQALDASNIAPRLWVGGCPPVDRDLPEFDVLVLCAAEYQPQELAFHGRCLRCPMPDGQLSDGQLGYALIVAREVAAALTRGRRVLVTCVAGLDRAALMAALALMMLTRRGADDLVALIRARRSSDALSNPHLRAALRRVAGAGRLPNR